MSTNSSNNNDSTNQPTIPPSLSHLAPLTKNELLLLSTYDKIKQYEKIAAKLKATEAKRRLDEADERYRAKVRERERLENGGDEHADDRIDGDNLAARQQQYDSDDEEDEATKQQRLEKQKQRQLEIKQLRSEIEAKSQQEAERDAARKRVEDMRKELLGPEGTTNKKKKRTRAESSGGDEEQQKMSSLEGDVTNDHDILQQQHDEDDDMDQVESQSNNNNNNSAILSGPSIKKKRLTSPTSTTTPSTSLIANLNGNITPIHDFSSKLQMSKTSLDGSILFPTTIGQPPWRPPVKPTNFMDGCFELELPNFNADNLSNCNNTLAIKFSAPQESARFSVNIASVDHNGYDSVLFHFNPRQFQRGGQLVMNSKEESMWGNDLSVPLSTLPLVFGKAACTLIVQINEEGFDVFVEGQHCARLEHRMALPKGKNNGSLCLQFPASDDYGNPEDWEVYRVWWGRKVSMAGSDLSGVAGVNIYSSVHPKKLFVSGLTKVHSDPEVDLRRAELERAFRKYGGPNGAVYVSVQKDSTFAFVEVASEQQADLALVEMAGRYRVNKARRTKHEALMEERAAREAAEKGITKDSVDWD